MLTEYELKEYTSIIFNNDQSDFLNEFKIKSKLLNNILNVFNFNDYFIRPHPYKKKIRYNQEYRRLWVSFHNREHMVIILPFKKNNINYPCYQYLGHHSLPLWTISNSPISFKLFYTNFLKIPELTHEIFEQVIFEQLT